MDITIDTSALIAVIGNEATKYKIIDITEGCSLCAPTSVHWEIGNAFSAMFRQKRLSVAMAQQALLSYKAIAIKFIDVPLEQTLEIAQAQNMYAYDVYLIQCAQLTSTPLLTLDNSLKNNAAKSGIQLLGIA